MRFGEKGKLSPRYIGTYEVMERIGTLAYILELHPELSRLHDVFRVSFLCKYLVDPSHQLKTQPIELKEDLSYIEEPVKFFYREEQVLRNKVIALIKVMWMIHGIK